MKHFLITALLITAILSTPSYSNFDNIPVTDVGTSWEYSWKITYYTDAGTVADCDRNIKVTVLNKLELADTINFTFLFDYDTLEGIWEARETLELPYLDTINCKVTTQEHELASCEGFQDWSDWHKRSVGEDVLKLIIKKHEIDDLKFSRINILDDSLYINHFYSSSGEPGGFEHATINQQLYLENVGYIYAYEHSSGGLWHEMNETFTLQKYDSEEINTSEILDNIDAYTSVIVKKISINAKEHFLYDILGRKSVSRERYIKIPY